MPSHAYISASKSSMWLCLELPLCHVVCIYVDVCLHIPIILGKWKFYVTLFGTTSLSIPGTFFGRIWRQFKSISKTPSNINLRNNRYAVIHPFVFLRVSVGNSRDSHDAFLMQGWNVYAIKLTHTQEVQQLIWVLNCICIQIIPYQRSPSVDLGMHRADWFTLSGSFPSAVWAPEQL